MDPFFRPCAWMQSLPLPFTGSQNKHGAALVQRRLTVLHKHVRDLEFSSRALPAVAATGGLTGRWRCGLTLSSGMPFFL